MIIEILIAFLGIFFGLLLKRATIEEVKQGRKYIVLFKDLILLSIIIIAIGLNFTYLLFLGIFIGFFLRFLIKNIYFYFGLILSLNYSLLIVCLVFIFGVNYGALYKLRYEFLFFVPFLLLFFDLSYISLLIGVGIGGIFNALKDS